MRFATTYQRRGSRFAFLGALRNALWNYPQTIVYLLKHLRRTRNVIAMLLVLILLYGIYGYLYSAIQEQRGVQKIITIGIIDSRPYSPLGDNTLSQLVNKLVFQSLITVDEAGNPSPLLASSWQLKNNTSIVFNLEKGIVWEDGKPFSAIDVMYSFGVAQKINPKGLLAKATSKEIDNNTVEIDFSNPDNNIWQDLTWPVFPNHPVVSNYDELGTGPYVLNGKANNEYHLYANPQYASAPIANKEVIIRTYQTETELYQAFTSGYINAYMLIDPNAEIAHDLLNEKTNYLFSKDLVTTYNALFFNMNTLKDINLRKGIAYAINKKKMQEMLSGYLQIQNGPINPLSSIYSSDTSYATYPYSLQNALASFEAAGYTLSDGKLYDKQANPLALTLSYPDSIPHADVLDSVVQDLQSIGISITKKAYTQDDWANQVILDKHFDIAFGQIQQGIEPDPYTLWDSNSAVNVSSYTNPTVNRILELARSTYDLSQRREGYVIFSRLLMNDLPAVFLYSPSLVFEAKPNVKGISIDKGVGDDVDIFDTIQHWYI